MSYANRRRRAANPSKGLPATVYRATAKPARARTAAVRASSSSPAYRAAVDVVRQRAKDGEPCYFWGACPHCPGVWNWGLPTQHGGAFTAHHLHRLMDGGAPIPSPAHMAPAHRACNSWDGLRAQNTRRTHRATYTQSDEPTSRHW